MVRENRADSVDPGRFGRKGEEAEPHGVDLGTEPDELVDAAGLMVQAIDGLKERFDVMAWQNEALQFGARMVHERPERVAAAINKRPTR